MTKEELDFIGAMNMCDEISNEAYKKIMCHCEEEEVCEDCIDREWIKTAIHNFYSGSGHIPTEEDIQAYLDVAPSVKSKPKTGYWILDETDNSIICNKCGCRIWANDIFRGDAHYCPNCGSYNGGGEDGK